MNEVKNQLRRIFSEATETELIDGLTWYARAFDFCEKVAKENGLSVDYVIRACAILSAQTPWDKNMAFTAILAQGGNKPAEVPQLRWDNAVAGKLPETDKVSNFYLSIATQGQEGICCDSHIFKACYQGKPPVDVEKYFKSRKLYAGIADVMREVAQEFSVTPAQFQAIVWTVWRNRNAYAKKHFR